MSLPSPTKSKSSTPPSNGEKELVWGDGNHYDYYDSPNQIDFAVHLGAQQQDAP
jgi:hypothetical protein